MLLGDQRCGHSHVRPRTVRVRRWVREVAVTHQIDLSETVDRMVASFPFGLLYRRDPQSRPIA